MSTRRRCLTRHTGAMATVAGIAAGLLATYLVLLVVLARARPDGATAREVVRLLPDLVRLVARLARDRTLPRRARIRLWLLLRRPGPPDHPRAARRPGGGPPS